MNKAGLAAFAFLGVLPSIAAACSGDQLFACPIGSKVLTICVDDEAATYSFGPHGRPELELNESFSTLDYHPWVGMGRWEQNWVAFTNGAYEYRVSVARDRLDTDRQELWEVGVTVLQGSRTITRLTCETSFDHNVLEVLGARKREAGLCWSRDDWTWKVSEECLTGGCVC